MRSQESANAVRSIVGGIELLMSLLSATDLKRYRVCGNCLSSLLNERE